MPNFWTSPQMNDPKRNSRWVLLSNSIPAYTLKSVSRPELSFGEVKHTYLGHEFKFPGNATWTNINFTFVDPVDPDMAATIMDVVKYAGYHPLANANDFATVSKRSAMKALGNIQIVMLDSIGEPVEIWTPHGAWLQNVKLSELSYDSDTLADVTVTLVYDWAELQLGKEGKSNYDKSKLGADALAQFGGFKPTAESAENSFRGGNKLFD